jgi:hypothetical protein
MRNQDESGPLLMASWGVLACYGEMPILLAQGTDTPAGQQVMLILFLVGVAIPLVIGVAITIATILLASNALKAVPPQYRRIEPGMVWLLLIPLINVVWTFFVFPGVSRSFQRYFAAQGRTEHGDCGERIGLWFAICFAVCWACFTLPFLSAFGTIPDSAMVAGILIYIAGPAALLLLAVYLAKIVGLKKYVAT